MLRIKEIAKRKDISINDLADKLGISRVTLHSQMNGNPTVETLQKIADVLEVEVSELFESSKTNKNVCPHCGKEIQIEVK